MTTGRAEGFTLIEIMIVIAIIAILASIALPAYQDYISKAQMSEAFTLADSVKTPISEVFGESGVCPANGVASVPPTVTGRYVASVVAGGTASSTGGCKIVATMNGSGLATGISGATVTMIMATTPTQGSYVWSCTSSALQKYVATACTGT